MTSHDQYPVQQEDRTFEHQEILQFNDGLLALKFGTPGDRVLLGHDSKHKYASNFDIDDRAIIRTTSGNQYWLAGGFVININERTTHRMPEETIDIKIGESCTIPGIAITTPVDAVLIDYRKMAAPDYGDKQIDAESPFHKVDTAVRSIKRQIVEQQQGQPLGN